MSLDNSQNEVAGHEEYTGPMGNYKVIGEIYPCNEDGSLQETPLEIGSIYNVPSEVGDDWVSHGLAEAVVDGVSGETPSSESASATSNKVSVLDERRHFVREYSLEVHGENFLEMAIAFAEKIKGSVIS